MPIAKDPAKVLKYKRNKRGGGATPASTYAPGPPTSSLHHGGVGHVPTIDGSEGGFIGLVVGLSLLFLGSSFGVWYLLKRRHDKGRRPIPFFNKLIGGRSKDPSATGGGGGFGRLASNDRRGWVRTNDGEDEYSDDESKGRSSSRRTTGVQLTEARSRSPVVTPQAEREGLYANDSNPFASPSTVRLQDHAGPYGDAFTTRPSTDSLDEAVHANATKYTGVSLTDPGNRASPPPTSPTLSSPTFERGTKFREGL